MDLDSRALDLIERIYHAATEPSYWQEVADEMSSAYLGSAVAIGIGLRGPVNEHHHFTAGLSDNFGPELRRRFLEGLPYERAMLKEFTERFRTLDAIFPDLELTETSLYRDWMEPRKLAPVWPIMHAIAIDGPMPPAVIIIFRPDGGPAFSRAEFALGDHLVPHLARAFDLYLDFAETHRERRALEDVINRLRVGVILVNKDGRPILWNRSAQAMFDEREVIDIRSGTVCATETNDDLSLQEALHAAVADRATTVLRLGATSGKSVNTLQIVANPLAASPPGSPGRDAVAALLVAGPDAISGASLRYMREIYHLTEAEAELVALLSRGASVEQAATERGVSRNTARSQLKQIFAKTGTRRQSDLVRLVFRGLSPLIEE